MFPNFVAFLIASLAAKTPEWVAAISAMVSAGGVLLVMRQLNQTKTITQLQFEDALAKEYRDLVAKIPTKALLGSGLSPSEYLQAFDEIFRYIDLSNEQVLLRKHDRIGPFVWENWCDGIKANLALPAFARAWLEIKQRTDQNTFDALRRLEEESFRIDPVDWRQS